MRKEIVVGALCLALGGVMARAEGTPKLQFDNVVYDFGVTNSVTALTGTFTFQNAGDAELTIQRPAPACGCTVASVKPDHLKPGEKGELVFTLTVNNIATTFQKTISVPSNDPKNPNMTLTIKAQVRQTFEIVPPSLYMGDLLPGTSTNAIVRIRRLDGKPLKNVRTETTGAVVKATATVMPNPDEQAAQVLLTAKNEGKPGRFAERIRLLTDDTPPAIAEIPVYGRLMGDVDINPEQVMWLIPERWAGNRTAVNRQEVTITATQPDQKLEVRHPTCSLKQVEVELITEQAGKRYRLVAKLPEPLKESARGMLSVEINVPAWHAVEVPVTIRVVKSNP